MSYELFSLGRIRSFHGRKGAQVAFPIGGIGTGTVSIGGRGDLRDWEIFNHPGKGKLLPMTFFAIWAREEGGEPVVKVLEGPIQPPYTGSHGLDRRMVPGLPRLHHATFHGEYPFAWVHFNDPDLPVEIVMEAFNPFIPLNDRDSGIPVAIIRYYLENISQNPVEISLVGSLMNAVGYNGHGQINGPGGGWFGGNLTRFRRDGMLVGLMMTSSKYPEDDPAFGSMALTSWWDGETTHTPRWSRAGWFDELQQFWDDFTHDGRLDPLPEEPSPDGRTDIGSFGLIKRLAPGEKAPLTFAISWYFPNRVNEWNREEAVRGKLLRNFYASIFQDAWHVAKYTFENLERLEGETRKFHRALFESTLPPYVLDAVSSQASIIRTNTCFRTDDGKFHAFEGCSDEVGCCPLNCTHVWNYEQALAHLFPQLERTMRETDFLFNTDEEGHMAFRTLVPLGLARWNFKPAADGQMGCIMKLYREWQLSGDDEFLRRIWPAAKRALEFAWKGWDADKDGVMEGEQHNTYDIEFYGPNPMMGTLYLGALLAGARMAEALGEKEKAEEYLELFEKGRRKLDELLWNGEYYVQKHEGVMTRKYQFGEGCLSDQMLGQWFAHVVGLGYLLPPERVKSAIKAVYRYNFRDSLLDHSNCQRTYALQDERGLLLCSWPHGGRPPFPFPYSDEVWTGIEYQVAAHLIYEGMLYEGLSIVKAARDRHDGERRNPWNEIECGDHYARAMSSWSVLLALSGYAYSAPQRAIYFAPRFRPHDFRCFWSTGSGWGTFSQIGSSDEQFDEIRVLYGKLELESVGVAWAVGERPSSVTPLVVKGSEVIESSVEEVDSPRNVILIRFAVPIVLYEGESISIKMKA